MSPSQGELESTKNVCLREFERVARSFWLIPGLIPPGDRLDVALLYCFCRTLDDEVDEGVGDHRRERLASFREEIAGERAPRPLVALFLEVVQRRALCRPCLDLLLDGMSFDLDPVRIADDADLLRYCYRVSASVGLLLAPLLGVRGEEALPRVVDWGLALQLSNILLGVADDAGRDRVYLPDTRLRREGLSAKDVLSSPGAPRVVPVLRGVAGLAARYYTSAERGIPLVPLRYRHGVLLLSRVYRALGEKAAMGKAAPAIPAELARGARLGHLLKLLLAAVSHQALGTRPAPRHDRALHVALDPSWPGIHH